MSQGMAVPYILKEYCTPDLPDDHLVVAIGDDKSDEDIFAALPVRSLRGRLGASASPSRTVPAGLFCAGWAHDLDPRGVGVDKGALPARGRAHGTGAVGSDRTGIVPARFWALP